MRIGMVTLAATVVLSACTGTDAGTDGEPQPDETLDVVATTTILGDITSLLVADHADVQVLLEAGQDPHQASLSAQQREAIAGADLVVANGLGLEDQLLDALEAAQADGVRVVYVAEEIEQLPMTEEEVEEGSHEDTDHEDTDHDISHGAEDEGGHDHADGDPHFWLDPDLVLDGSTVIHGELFQLAPELSQAWTTGMTERLGPTVIDARNEVEEVLAVIPDRCRVLVTNHDAFGHFAHAFEFEVLATVLPGNTTLAEPSSRHRLELQQLMDDVGVGAIFVEEGQDATLAESVAADLEPPAEVVPLYTGSLGAPGSGADTYAGMLTTNARRIADALADC